MKQRIPLAWLQLSQEKARMLTAIAGISFADVLMSLQMGFRTALLDGAVQFHKSLQGEIVLINSRYGSLTSLDRFSERRLYQALGFTGVQSVTPIYLDFIQWKNPQKKTTWSIFAIGLKPEDKAINLAGVQENLESLKTPDTVLFDSDSRKEFGLIAEQYNEGNSVTTEVGNHKISVGGLFKLGTSFGITGNIIMSDVNFLRLFGVKRQKGLIDIGLIKLDPGADKNQVLINLRTILPHDVKVLSKQEFIEQEKNYWNTRTPMGYVFNFGIFIGFSVGAASAYQILDSDIAEHLSEYATLKAIGFKNRYLLTIVLEEALILAVLGFVPGTLLSLGLYQLIRQATLLPMVMTLGKAISVLILTTVMCLISAALSIRRLESADPADIF